MESVSDFSKLTGKAGEESGAFSSRKLVDTARRRPDINRNCSQCEGEICNRSRLVRCRSAYASVSRGFVIIVVF